MRGPGIEPRSAGPLANTLPTRPMHGYLIQSISTEQNVYFVIHLMDLKNRNKSIMELSNFLAFQPIYIYIYNND